MEIELLKLYELNLLNSNVIAGMITDRLQIETNRESGSSFGLS